MLYINIDHLYILCSSYTFQKKFWIVPYKYLNAIKPSQKVKCILESTHYKYDNITVVGTYRSLLKNSFV